MIEMIHMSDTPAQQPPSGPKPNFEDITLYDQETGEPFIFTAKEQEFFWRQGFTNVPKRSPERRKEMREKRAKGKPIFNITCKLCGKVGKILVEPHDPRDIYCETCFAEVWEEYLDKHPDVKAMHEKADQEAASLEAQQ
jgi:CxxC-x17-CxxC domain-containing protein